MTPLQALRELQSRSLVTIEGGDPCEAELLPALSPVDIDELQERIGAPVPPEIRELMATAAGVDVDGEELSWHGGLVGQHVEGAFPCAIDVMEDGLGNSWMVDIDPFSGAWGPVYFVCHDPPVVVRQAGSLSEFIIQFADDACQPEREGALFYTAERRALKVWDTGGTLLDAETLRGSTDAVLRRAASAIHEADGALVCDLRAAHNGDGFSWGRYGPRTIVSRPGAEALWVIQRPVGSKKWWKLWG